ncbi:hypothetical protein ACRB68_41500 [Actinomadura sp. RB68]|uniref:Knr4/Smi1-like domain-containing protein n=1 Tax=Actinomadura macrotermitis TaxID=2585200 RepID=A0A7K0BY04_9ACTN|nr:hypothetical protein [Actinomadura macrotermitis]
MRSWEEVFQELGTALPADFVALIERYGAFEVGGLGEDDHGERDYLEFLVVADPRSEHRKVTWAQAAVLRADAYNPLREAFPDMHRLWPEPGGFLGWGTTIDGDWFGWLTEGEPDEWPIVADGRDDEWRGEPPLRITATEFLLHWFSGAPDLPHMAQLWAGGEWEPVECKPLSS